LQEKRLKKSDIQIAVFSKPTQKLIAAIHNFNLILRKL